MSTQTTTRQKYGFSKVVSLDYESAVERVKEQLKKEGFGVLAERYGSCSHVSYASQGERRG